MAEYIEREAALRTAHIMRPEDKCLEAAIANIPAADVAPVVRCKDCKYGEFVKRGSKYSCRKVEGFLNFHNFYCKDGARKEDAE